MTAAAGPDMAGTELHFAPRTIDGLACVALGWRDTRYCKQDPSHDLPIGLSKFFPEGVIFAPTQFRIGADRYPSKEGR